MISPGPGRPESGPDDRDDRRGRARGAFRSWASAWATRRIAAYHGGVVERAPAPRHGKTSRVTHDGAALFAGLPNPFEAARYHSLVVREEGLPAELA